MDLEEKRKNERKEPDITHHAISGKYYDFYWGQKKGMEEHKNRQMDKLQHEKTKGERKTDLMCSSTDKNFYLSKSTNIKM